ncbi:MAG: acetylserotonin O-methyltransferase [Actinomycetota bacterium]|nr:acetylserotonin O-methyltransferase [Actinomycetota bacterium]
MTTHEPAATATGPRATEPSPATIMELASGFMAAKHLFAANELGLFEALADAPATLDALAARTGLTRRAARISADAMVALGLLEVHDGTYRNGMAAARFLAGPGPEDLRPFLRFWDKISYPAWTRLAEALASGPPREIFELDDELQQVASAGIEAILAGPATVLPQVFDFGSHERLLDIGGGTGSWSIAIAQRHQHVTGAVLELPTAFELARSRVAAAGLGHRITVVTGDAMADELPAGYDVFLLANLTHYWSAEQNQELLQRVRRAAQPGSAVLLADFWTNPAHTEPLQAALMAGEFAAHIRTGDVYSVDEARDWLDHTGWRFTGHHPLAGPQSLIIAQAA